MNKLIYSLLVVLFAISGLSAQQESQYTMSMYNKLNFNPAYAGVKGVPSAQLMYRRQWFGIEGAPVSKLVSFNTSLSKERVGFGLQVANREIGFFDQWSGSMAYNYRIRIREDFDVRVGLQASMLYYGINFADPRFSTTEGMDPSVLDNTDTEKYKGNFGAGVYVNYKNFFVGASVPHVLINEIGFNTDEAVTPARTLPHFYLMTGLILPIGNGFQFQPTALGKYVKNAPVDLELAANFIYDNRITMGLGYRVGGIDNGESISLMSLYQANRLGVGISYDFPLGRLSNSTSGSLEFLVRYDMFQESANMANPRFFQ